MPVTVTEKAESRSLVDGESAELIYAIRGTASQNAAMTELKATAPAMFEGLYRQKPRIEPEFVDASNDDVCIWIATVNYGSLEFSTPQTGDSAFSFDTGGGTQHITQSLQTVEKYPNTPQNPGDPVAPNMQGAIGVAGDNVEGVDITVPVYTFTETHYIDAAIVDNAYKATLFGLTGKVNNAPFKGLAGSECLFLGASGSYRESEDDWEITYSFAGSPNRTNFPVGGITGIDKMGWEYLWVLYENAVDEEQIIKKPSAVYIEKVYEYGDFSALGIGT